MKIKVINTPTKVAFYEPVVLSLEEGHYNLNEIIEKTYLFNLFVLEQEGFDNVEGNDENITGCPDMIQI